MENKFENVELLDEIVTLYDEENNATEFNEIAIVEYDGEFYALLEPVEEMEGVEEGEVIILKVTEHEDGEDEFSGVEDEEIADAVFAEYLKAVEDEGCGCGCDDCDGHCDEH